MPTIRELEATVRARVRLHSPRATPLDSARPNEKEDDYG
jgi:hypothetical protein